MKAKLTFFSCILRIILCNNVAQLSVVLISALLLRRRNLRDLLMKVKSHALSEVLVILLTVVKCQGIKVVVLE